MVENPLPLYVLTMFGLVVGPWVFWYVFAVVVSFLQRKWNGR